MTQRVGLRQLACRDVTAQRSRRVQRRPSRSASSATTFDADVRFNLRSALLGRRRLQPPGRGTDAPDLRGDQRQHLPADVRLGRQPAGSRCGRSTSTPSGAATATTTEIAAELNGDRRTARHAALRHRVAQSRPRDDHRHRACRPTRLSFTGSFAAGKDDYLESQFGLRDNNHQVYSAGFEYAPSEYVGAGLSYSYERYTSLSRSRQANRDATEFADPVAQLGDRHAPTGRTRSSAICEMLQIVQNVDVIVFGDYNRDQRASTTTSPGPVPDRTLPEEVDRPDARCRRRRSCRRDERADRANVDVIYCALASDGAWASRSGTSGTG